MTALKDNNPVRRYRLAAGLRLWELAEKIDISVPSLSKIERGKQEPSLSIISRLIKVSKGELSADDFLQGVQ
jgi:transcriptional regulator with XRE-family HTH domain